jgi:hypothetical protein
VMKYCNVIKTNILTKDQRHFFGTRKPVIFVKAHFIDHTWMDNCILY